MAAPSVRPPPPLALRRRRPDGPRPAPRPAPRPGAWHTPRPAPGLPAALGRASARRLVPGTRPPPRRRRALARGRPNAPAHRRPPHQVPVPPEPGARHAGRDRPADRWPPPAPGARPAAPAATPPGTPPSAPADDETSPVRRSPATRQPPRRRPLLA